MDLNNVWLSYRLIYGYITYFDDININSSNIWGYVLSKISQNK